MKKIFILVALASVALVRCAQPQQASSTAAAAEPTYKANITEEILTLRYDDDLVRAAQAAYAANDPAFLQQFNYFKSYMDRNVMTLDPVYITDDVRHLPPSGDPRDQISLSSYWYPDPDTDDGLPYIRKDGLKNPETADYRSEYLCSMMASGAEHLAFIYLITGDEKYAAKAATFLRAFFLDEERGMNPNITFIQHVPGMKRIRGTGLLGSGDMTVAVNAAKMMESSESWTDEDEAAMQDWAAAYLYWFEYSTHGQEEFRGGNNHAMWYEVNREALVLYCKEYDYLAEVIMKYQFPRLSEQIAADSTMPHEIARTRGIHYTTYTLSAVTQTAIMARKIGINEVWTHVGPNGRGMLWAVDFIIPYWKDPSGWPYVEINFSNQYNIPFILSQVGKGSANAKYTELAEEFGFTGNANYEANVPSINSVLYYKLRK